MATTMKRILAVTKRGEKAFWTQVGVAFVNRDGSLNLKFDYLPTSPATTIQVREMGPRGEQPADGGVSA